MSREINELFISLEQLRRMLEDAWDKAGVASAQAVEIGGEFEQEISTDIDGFQVAIRSVSDDLDVMIDEAKTLWGDLGLDNEENYKVDAEHIQEEMREEKE
jgi:hypothetical protein